MLITLAPPASMLASQQPTDTGSEAHRAGQVQGERGGEHIRLPLVTATREIRPGVVDQNVEVVQRLGDRVDGARVGHLAAEIAEPAEVRLVLPGVGLGAGHGDLGPGLGRSWRPRRARSRWYRR